MENNQRNSRKRLNSLILLVAFTAVMLIVSTYAWFSAQKNVTIGGLQGQVSVAEGLEISLDAKYWSQEVNFGDYDDQWDLKKLYGTTGGTLKDGDDLSASANHNIIPTELLPVSTTGNVNDGIKETDMNFYRGINQNGNELYQIIEVKKMTGDGTEKGDVANTYSEYGETSTTALTAATHDYPGYYAIDLFLRNSTKDVSESAIADGLSNYTLSNALQLNSNSKLELLSSAATSTGLQNTVRVAFALYNMNESKDKLAAGDESWNDILPDLERSAYMLASQEQILAAYKDQTINDVAIWEPNSENHVQYVVDNNNSVKWDATEQAKYGIPTDDDATVPPTYFKNKFGLETPTPTYALTSASTNLSAMADLDDPANGLEKGDTNVVMVGSTATKGITDIYDWDATPYEGLAKQVTLQTTMSDDDNFTVGKVKQLISVTSTAANRYTIGDSARETGAKEFKIPKGKVCKVRMYVWLEGQDVDTINHASHGGGIYLDVGLIKDATAES